MIWKPSISRETWLLRLDLIHRTRSFFASRNCLEVETPVLSRAMGTDPHLDYMETSSLVDGVLTHSGIPHFLGTSPEFHMKRLLSAGWGDIWQLCKAFRGGEFGPRHNPEFSILEWYRVGWDWNQLMQEVADLCRDLSEGSCSSAGNLARQPHQIITWREAYRKHCGFDPLQASLAEIQQVAQIYSGENSHLTRAQALDLLMVCAIEPFLGKSGLEFLVSYPPEQAALAQIEQGTDGFPWAKRFELYLDGIELCNGYQELSDAEEQARRFAADLELRRSLGKRIPPLDQQFLGALQAGMPACSGVALGFDRLVMLFNEKKAITEVIAFPEDRC